MKTYLNSKWLSIFIFGMLCVSSVVFAAGKPLTIGIAQEFETLNPITAKTQASLYLYGLVGRALVMQNSDGKWVPHLAEKIPSIKNGDARIVQYNGKSVLKATWKIHSKARWSDGRPIVCEDFQLARQVADSPNISVSSKETYTLIEKIEWSSKEPQTCFFTYAKTRWDYYRLNLMFPLPAHIEKSIFEKYAMEKEGYDRHNHYVDQPTMLGLYNGPYQVSEIKLGSHIVFTPNPFFFGAAPKIEKIIVKLIPDTGTLFSNLRAQSIDLIGTLGLTFDQALEIEEKVKNEKLPYAVVFKPSIAYEHIEFNLENSILKDIQVRQALMYAVNRDELVESFYSRKQMSADHFLPPLDPWFPSGKSFRMYKFNPKNASAILQKAGWILNLQDGFRYKNNKKLSLQLMTTAGNKNRETLQVYLKNSWQKVGVEVIFKNEPARILFSETIPKRKFGGMVLYANSAAGDLKPSFHSSQIPSEKNGWSGRNVMSWHNDKVDQLIEKVEGELDFKKQFALVNQVVRIYTEELPSIPLFFRTNNAVIPSGLNHFKLFTQPDETNEAEFWGWK